MAEESIHKGHRQRMLKRYLEHGIDSFEDHELLEIFLFSVYTRRNTNDIAHRLIERFGSLEEVMHVDYDALFAPLRQNGHERDQAGLNRARPQLLL